MGSILYLVLWFSPYWWVKKFEKDVNDIILAIILAAMFFLSVWIHWSMFISIGITCIHFFIAYCCECLDWDSWKSSPSYSSRSSNQWTQSANDSMCGLRTTIDQEKLMKDFMENV